MSVDCFDQPIQQKIVALMIKDQKFMLKAADHIKPFYFDSEVLIDLSRMALDYFKKYNTLFSPTSLLSTVSDFLSDNKREEPSIYFNTVSEIYKDDLPEHDYLQDKVIEFVLFQEIRNALYESADLLREKQFDKIKRKLDKAYKIAQETLPGTNYFDQAAIQSRYADTESDKVSTGLPELDKCLGGGLGVGELGIILAPPNVGKSILLTIIGANALRNRVKVLHISLEMSEKKIALRYDRNLIGKGRQVIKDEVDSATSFLIQFARNMKTDLHIKHWPTRTASIVTMRAYLEQLKGEGFVPGLILVDYSGIMKASTARDARHLEIEEANEDLRGWAGELGVPLWTAAQTKASGVNKAVLTIEDLGESFAQSKVADVIVAASQTKKEHTEDKMRLVLAKNRDDKKFQVLEYETAFDVMRIKYSPGG